MSNHVAGGTRLHLVCRVDPLRHKTLPEKLPEASRGYTYRSQLGNHCNRSFRKLDHFDLVFRYTHLSQLGSDCNMGG